MSDASSNRRSGAALSAGLLAAAIAVGFVSQPAGAQDQPQQNQQDQGQGGRRGGGFDPEQFRQRMNDRMKQALAASDEEWGVLQPKIEKVMTLQRQNAGGRGMGMLFRGGPGGGRGDGAPGGGRGDGGGRRGAGGPFGGDDNSPVAQKTRDLQQAVEGNASADDLKAKMTALREARAKARADLAQAQGELKELLTARQEAALVMMGLLE
jgi:hypothetical protein